MRAYQTYKLQFYYMKNLNKTETPVFIPFFLRANFIDFYRITLRFYLKLGHIVTQLCTVSALYQFNDLDANVILREVL